MKKNFYFLLLRESLSGVLWYGLWRPCDISPARNLSGHVWTKWWIQSGVFYRFPLLRSVCI